MKKEIFISYSRKDTAVVDRICAALGRANISYFIDRQGIGGGMEFPQVLAEAIIDCEIFLYIGSANSYTSKFTNSEITFAFNKKERNRIIPYFIDDAPIPAGIEFTFSAINWRNIKTHPIEPMLVNDILSLLGRSKPKDAETSEQEETPTPEQLDEWCNLSHKYEINKDLANSLKWARKAAEHGSAHGQHLLALKYEFGIGVPKSYTEAMKWDLKAAEQGYLAAQNNLGYHYANGVLGAVNLEEAEKWLVKAAEKGHPMDQFNLGYRFEHGNKVKKDLAKAVYWYLKAAEKGQHDAQYHLGILYHNGNGVARDLTEAKKWFTKAAEGGELRAANILKSHYSSILPD